MRNGIQKLGKKTGGIGNLNRDHPNHCIHKIDENNPKSLVDQRGFAVTETSVKNH